MPSDPHPTAADLVAFHTGDLPPVAIDRLTAHLEGCPACEAELARLDGQTGAAADAVRGAAGLPPADGAGVVLAGRYRLVGPLGAGGMGTVWRAEQVAPVRRAVAVKLVKPGMDSAAVLRRFAAERQALAVMDHPHIARVFDAGQTPAGRPFFVMELVEGVPITAYCDDHKLTPRQRLGLFVAVCQAVQHAHQKGVIHRDLKPSNILVAEADGRPVPKVIDFGIAKATGLDHAGVTVQTSPGGVVGTPEYMAPEQAEPGNLDVDTRADVYALGVLLYELLTGSTPLTRQRVKTAALLEVLRLVREEEPPTPSGRLSAADALPSLAAERGTEPRRLAGLVRGELDWIALKCLEKDRGRRYESAAGLARDVERYLADEPVEAGRPTPGYRLRKLLRRHRRPVLAAGLLVGTLAAAAAVSTWQAVRATRAEAAATVALRETAAVADFLADAFRKPHPDADGPGLKVADLLAPAADRLDADTGLDPRTKARLRVELAAAHAGLGLADRAVALGRAAVAEATAAHGPDAALTFTAVNGLALALTTINRPADAVPLLADALGRQELQLGRHHPDTLTTLNNLALALHLADRPAEARPLFEECLAARTRVLPPDHRNTLTTLHNLATLDRQTGRLADGIRRLEECLRRRRATLPAGHPDIAISLHSLGQAYLAAGRPADAVPLLEESLAGRQARLAPDHRQTLNTLTVLGSTLRAAGRVRDAVRVLEESVARHTAAAALGPDHPGTLTAVNNLARAYQDAGRYADSVPLLEECVRRRTARAGREDADTLPPRLNLGRAYREVGRLADASRELAAVLAVYRQRQPPGHRPTLLALLELALTHERAGRTADAAPLWDELLAAHRRADPGDRPALATALEARGQTLLARGEAAAAEPVLREAVAVRDAAGGGWAAANARSLLGDALLAVGNPAAAEGLLLAGCDGLQRAGPLPEHSGGCLPAAVDRLVRLYVTWGRPAEAARWRAERAKYPPEQAPSPRPVS